MVSIRKITKTDVDYAFRSTLDISPGFLHEHGIKGLILDIDNTLAVHDDPVPADGIEKWADSMKSEKIKLIILSNNHSGRVKAFADRLGVDFVCDGGKPLKRGYVECMKKMGLSARETAAVGDQLFTDVWGANHAGLTMLFVEPIAPEPKNKRFIRFKRVLEKPFLPKKFVDDKKE